MEWGLWEIGKDYLSKGLRAGGWNWDPKFELHYSGKLKTCGRSRKKRLGNQKSQIMGGESRKKNLWLWRPVTERKSKAPAALEREGRLKSIE